MLHDGALVHAEPHDTDDYGATAKRLGYGEDRDRMNRDHELLHTAIGEFLSLRESPVMRAVADNVWQSDAEGFLALEEETVCCIQKLCNAYNVDVLLIIKKWFCNE